MNKKLNFLLEILFIVVFTIIILGSTYFEMNDKSHLVISLYKLYFATTFGFIWGRFINKVEKKCED